MWKVVDTKVVMGDKRESFYPTVLLTLHNNVATAGGLKDILDIYGH